MNKIISLPTPSARISPKVRAAIDLMVRKGLSQGDAAKDAGLSRQGLCKALKRAAVRDLMGTTRVRFIAEAEGLRAYAKARAIEVALDMMLNSKSETIRARMVEFLASDAKVSPVSVHVDARKETPFLGYRLVRPGETLPKE